MIGKTLTVVAVFMVLLVAACAPAAAPAITPAPAPAPPEPAVAPVAPALTSEEAEWQKVVAAAKKEGKVTIYSFNFTGDFGKAVASGFEAKYDIKVELVTGVLAVLRERIKSEQAARKYTADILDGATLLVALGKDEGLTAPAGEMPVLKEKGVWRAGPQLDKEGHLFLMATLVQTPYINTSMVKAGDIPTSYKDLLQPRWKGKIVVENPLVGPLLARLYVAMTRNKVLDEDYFRRLGQQQLIVAPNIREQDGILLKGEAAITPTGVSLTLNPFIQEGAPIRPIPFEEGTLAPVTPAITMVNHPPHPNAARLFINWFLTAEGQTAYHKSRKTIPVRSDVPDFSPEAGKFQPKRLLVVDIAMELEAARLQREGAIGKIIGVVR